VAEILREREQHALIEAEKDNFRVDETTSLTKRITRPANITAEEAVIGTVQQSPESIPGVTPMKYFMLAIFKTNVMKVIARMRAQKRLQKIKRFMHHYNYSKEAISTAIDTHEGTSITTRDSLQNRNNSLLSFNIHEGSLRHAGFPTFEKSRTSFSEVPTHSFVKYETFPELQLRVRNKHFLFNISRRQRRISNILPTI
jgi:hypothetical protein